MPKNKKFGKTPTGNYSSYMSDGRKAFDFTMNRMYDMLEEYTYHKEQNIFQAVVLSGLSVGSTAIHSAVVNSVSSGGTKTVLLKIRFYQIDEVFNYVTDPRLAESVGETRFLIDAHPDAVLEIPSNQNSIPPPGAVLKVEKIGMTYYVRDVLSDTSDYILTSSTPAGSGAKKSFNNTKGGKSTKALLNYLSSLGGKKTKGKKLKNAPNLSWDALKLIAQSGVFSSVLNEIARYESGTDGYNAWNYDGGYAIGSNKLMTSIYGKTLSELTIEQIVTEVQVKKEFYSSGSKKHNRPPSTTAAFALGRYQIIPTTMLSALDTISGCNLSEVFGEIQQEAFGVFLLTMRRPTLGNYLMGDPKVTVDQAQTSMAREWAGVRISVPVYRNDYPPYMQLSAGQSYYANVGANPPDSAPGKASATRSALEAAREEISTNEKLKEIIELDKKVQKRQEKFEEAKDLVDKTVEEGKELLHQKAKQLGVFFGSGK